MCAFSQICFILKPWKPLITLTLVSTCQCISAIAMHVFSPEESQEIVPLVGEAVKSQIQGQRQLCRDFLHDGHRTATANINGAMSGAQGPRYVAVHLDLDEGLALPGPPPMSKPIFWRYSSKFSWPSPSTSDSYIILPASSGCLSPILLKKSNNSF